jgi:hypothetical protein
MARTAIRVYNGLTGDFCIETAGDGSGPSRMKSWLEEIPRWLKEAVEPLALKGLGTLRMANFPAFLNGERLAPFTGVDVWRVVPQTANLALGSGAVATFGSVALTQPDRAHADYYNTTTDPDDPVAPRGATAPAFLQTISDGGGNFALAATSGVIVLDINGVRYTTTAAQAAAVAVDQTAAQLVVVLDSFGWPMDVVAAASGNEVRIFAAGLGVTRNIRAVSVALDANSVLFTGAGASSQPNVMYRGTNGPLGVMDNTESLGGNKPQRLILPGSVSIAATIAAAAASVSDSGKDGVLAPIPPATHTGTINYTTGAVSVTFSANPDNATNVVATWKALKAMDLTQPVRLPVIPSGGAFEVALTPKP